MIHNVDTCIYKPVYLTNNIISIMSHRVARPRVGHTPRYPSGTLGVSRSRYVGHISVHQTPKSPRIMVRTVNDTATSIPSTALSSETGLFSGACDTSHVSLLVLDPPRQAKPVSTLVQSPLHPSPGFWFPSSQASFGPRWPLPQRHAPTHLLQTF